MTPSYLPKLLAITLLLPALLSPNAQQPDPAAAQRDVESLLAQAQGQVDPAGTNLMLQADTRAEAMARNNEGGCCGTRCIRIQPQPVTFNIQAQPLTFKWMEFQGNEVYLHDILKTIIFRHRGTPLGARILADYLTTTRCFLPATEWMPEFRAVLDILNLPEWRNSTEPALLRVRAESYETWWSLSIAPKSDPNIEANQINITDFKPGAQAARQSAIAAYRILAAQLPKDQDIRTHLRNLIAARDTTQRNWFCFAAD